MWSNKIGGGGVRGSEIQKSEKAHMHINLQKVVRQINLAPCEPGGMGGGGGGWGARNSKVMHINLQKVVRQINLAPCEPGGMGGGGGVGGPEIQKSEKVHD